MTWSGNARGGLFALCVAAFAASAQAASSVMIWPLSLAIKAPERAAALWLENTGREPVDLQVRVLSWDQAQGFDHYGAQVDIIGTPPFARIEPGRRQLIRLTMARPPAAAGEIAYRVLIDELPTVGESTGAANPGSRASAALRFLMRYSLPLFVYPDGKDTTGPTGSAEAPSSNGRGLSWRASIRDGRGYLHVRNDDPVHARLSAVHIQGPTGERAVIADGLLGYVLPGAEMRWPLPPGVVPATRDELRARLGRGGEPVPILRGP